MDTKKMIDIAMKRKQPELVLKNTNIVNVFTHEILQADIAINDGIIAGIGSYDGFTNIDCTDKYACPGLIDAHVHIESSMLSPQEFSKIIVSKGTTTIIADPHEIANVCGLEGISYILDSTCNIPLNVYVMLPSCVPATHFENSGAKLKAQNLNKLINNDRVLGLGELMNYPGVINNDKDVLDKINLASNKIIDGHAPFLRGKELNAYILAGVTTDHECSNTKEMLEKLRLGMYVLVRQGSAARDLKNLIKCITPYNSDRVMFCTDDKHIEDLVEQGHINYNVKLAIKEGLDPITAVKMATINAARCYNLKNIGAIAPGYIADIILVDDLENFNILDVYKNGKHVANNNKALFDTQRIYKKEITNTVNKLPITTEDLRILIDKDINTVNINTIQIQPHSLITKKSATKVNVLNKELQLSKNLAKLAVIERHKGTNNIGKAIIEGFDIVNGAIASTISHDSHNIIVIGDNDTDMVNAVNQVIKMQGGIAISSDNKILESLILEIGGLMTDSNFEAVEQKMKKLIDIAYQKLKVNKDIDPFLTLGFLALPVIPEIKLTDKGLFDVNQLKFINIVAN